MKQRHRTCKCIVLEINRSLITVVEKLRFQETCSCSNYNGAFSDTSPPSRLNENGTTYVIHRGKKNVPSPAQIAWLTSNSWPVRYKRKRERERERERERDDVTPFGVHVNRLWVNPRVKAAGCHSGAERLKRAAPRDPLVSSLTGKLNHVASGVAASSVLYYASVENAYGKRKRIVASIKDRPRKPSN